MSHPVFCYSFVSVAYIVRSRISNETHTHKPEAGMKKEELESKGEKNRLAQALAQLPEWIRNRCWMTRKAWAKIWSDDFCIDSLFPSRMMNCERGKVFFFAACSIHLFCCLFRVSHSTNWMRLFMSHDPFRISTARARHDFPSSLVVSCYHVLTCTKVKMQWTRNTRNVHTRTKMMQALTSSRWCNTRVTRKCLMMTQGDVFPTSAIVWRCTSWWKSTESLFFYAPVDSRINARELGSGNCLWC